MKIRLTSIVGFIVIFAITGVLRANLPTDGKVAVRKDLSQLQQKLGGFMLQATTRVEVDRDFFVAKTGTMKVLGTGDQQMVLLPFSGGWTKL